MRSVVAVLPIAIAALLLLPGGAPAALPDCPPEAPPDFTCVFTVDDHFVEDFCGFDVAIDAVGKVLYTPRFNRAGDLIAELFRPNVKVTLTGVASGRTATDRDVGLDMVMIAPDGSAEILSTGLHAKLRIGGRETIFRRIGLQIIHVDAEGNDTLEVIGGNFDEENPDPVLCAWLAG